MTRLSPPGVTIAIVGGGLAGWALAEALVRAGADPAGLLICEARLPGSGASGVPWGLMHPFPGRSLYPRPGYLAAWRGSLAWMERLQQAHEREIFRRLPLWRVSKDPATLGRFAKSYARGSGQVIDYPLFSADPAGFPFLAGMAAYALPEAAIARFGGLIGALRQGCQGVAARLLTGPLALRPSDAGWELLSDGLRIQARQVVLAPGAGLGGFLPDFPLELSRGEVAIFALPDGPETLPMAISAAGHYVAPLGRGRYLTGATHYAGARPWPPEQSWAQLRAGLSWLPGIDSARLLQIVSGLRCGPSDREPVVGPVPNQPGLWVMSGFSTRGLLLIPTAAETLAKEALCGELSVPAWMRPERFEPGCWDLRA